MIAKCRGGAGRSTRMRGVAISVFDLFTIGVGPSSSHTVGPMRAARRFVERLERDGLLDATARVVAELFGSLALDRARPRHRSRGDPRSRGADAGRCRPGPDRPDRQRVRANQRLRLNGGLRDPLRRWPGAGVSCATNRCPLHPNGMRFTAFGAAGEVLETRVYYSIGGGFVVERGVRPGRNRLVKDETRAALPVRQRRGPPAARHRARSGDSRADAGATSGSGAARPRSAPASPRIWAAMQRVRRARLPPGGHAAGRAESAAPRARALPRAVRARSQSGRRSIRSTCSIGSTCWRWR